MTVNNGTDIHKKIDEIILKNKEKLDRIYKDNINIENFSLKNKKGDTLFYLRKKTDRRSVDDNSPVIVIQKNADERKVDDNSPNVIKQKNADERKVDDNSPVIVIQKNADERIVYENSPDKIKGKKLRFKKSKKIIEDERNISKIEPKGKIESNINKKDFFKIDYLLNKEFQEETDEDKEIIDKKIIETTENNEFKQKNEDIGEIIAAELAKKLDLNTLKKMVGYKIIKHPTFDTDKIVNFLNLINKYKGIIKITDLVIADEDNLVQADEDILIQADEDILVQADDKIVLSDEDKLDSNNLNLINEEINDIKKSEEIVTKEIEDKKIIEEKIIKKQTRKKSFFNLFKLKKKKPSDKKTTHTEDLKTEPTKLMSTSVFRVENIPKIEKTDTEETNLIDKKIKEIPNYKDQVIEDIGKKAALKLASKHIKNSPSTENGEQTPQIDTNLEPVTKIDEYHEHIFFDEEEASSRGWSPPIFDEGRGMVPSTSPAKGDLVSEELKNLGEVELPKNVLQTKSVKLSELGFSEKEWHELDFYSLQEPFAYVEILQEKESLDKCYFFVEIALSQEEEELLNFIRETMSYQDIDPFELEKKNEDEYLLEQINKIIEEYNIEINNESKNKIYYHMRKTSLGMGKIDPFMRDPHIEDISCDGSGIPVFLYHRKFGSLKSNIRFDDEDHLSSFVFKLAQKCNKHISIAEPMIDATMPDGSRIQMTLSDEITTKGSTFTIRKFRADPFSPPDLVEFNTMSSEMIAYMWFAIENGVNTLFAGGTASGKTTALNALSLFIPRESKIVSIEETREINLPHPNWIPGVARSGFGEVVANKMIGEIDMYDLMKAALRQRPEYILVGEIRGREAYVLFQAMATGHATYSTVHADSAQSLIHRLEGKPINIPRIMLQSMDIVCLHVITRVKNFRARRCKQIIEIIDIDPTTKEILTNEVFRWDPVDDKFKYSGKSYVLERIRAEKDISRDEITNEIKNRMKLVEWMNKTNIREFREVANAVAHYNENPEMMLEKVDKEGED